MPITVRHDAPIAGMGAVAAATGQSLGNTQALGANNEIARFLLGYKENQRQFDTRQGFAEQQADRDLGMRLRAQDIEQRQYNQNLAMQDARQQQIAYSQAADRQAQLADQQMRMEYGAQQQQFEAQNEWAQKSAMSLDAQINEQFKSLRQKNLSPEGKLKRDELAGAWRKMQSESANFRPAAFAEAQGKLMADIERAGLDQYEIKEPTAQEKVYQNLVPLQGQTIDPTKPLPPGKYRSLKGSRNGVDSWETIDIPETQQPLTAAERFEQNKVALPGGGIALFDPETKKWQEFAPPKAATAEKPLDPSKYLKEAANQLRTEHQLAQAGSESPKAYQFDLNEAKKRARELMAAEQELMLEMNGGGEENGAAPELNLDESQSFTTPFGFDQQAPAPSDFLNRSPDVPPTPTEIPTAPEGLPVTPTEFDASPTTPTYDGRLLPGSDEGEQLLVYRTEEGVVTQNVGRGSAEDPYRIHADKLDASEIQRFVKDAPSGSIFIDENGNKFVKP